MKAVGISRFGGPEVLEVVHLPIPRPGPGQVRVRVTTAAVNPTDLLLREGVLADRMAHLSPPHVPGMDVSGTVDLVGEGVDDITGRPIMAFVNPLAPTGGAQAEYVVVPVEQLVELPPRGLDPGDAGGLPMNSLTAHQALMLLSLPAGATLGVTGAAGAVGGFTIQLGKHRGLRVVADAAESDRDLVLGLGADVVVPRSTAPGKTFRAAVPDGVDGLVDAAVIGRPALDAVREGGAFVACRPIPLPSERGITIHQALVLRHPAMAVALREIVALAAEGRLTPRTADILPVEQVASAHRRLAAGGVRGRLLLSF
ncbi:NADP-dependent oxidoreductase [Streptomyces calidiresistens]